MTPSAIRSSRTTVRLGLGLACLALAGYAFTALGRFMAVEDPLVRADAIFVFAGRYVERPLEAADLYNGGYAPRIVITRAVLDKARHELDRRKIRIPTEHDLTATLLREAGVPDSALVLPRFVHDNTAEEARTLRELALQHGWRRVIIVSSKYHMRRVKLAAVRHLRDTGVEILARASRYDASAPDQWWTRRSDVRLLAAEVPKLVAYSLGIGL